MRSFAEGKLFAEILGEGTPRVLALHGWGRRGSDFKQGLGDLPVLAPDLPGFGASPAPTEVIGAEGYADIVAETLTAFEEPPVLVGHSFGGRVAVCLGAKLPDRVGPILLTGAPLLRTRPPRPPTVSYRVMRMLNRLGLVSEERMEVLRRRTGSADYRAATGVMRGVLVQVVNETYEDQLRELRSPVLLLWGGSDREVPVAVARTAVDVISDGGGTAQLRVLDGVGHQVPTEAPDALRKAVDSLLE